MLVERVIYHIVDFSISLLVFSVDPCGIPGRYDNRDAFSIADTSILWVVWPATIHHRLGRRVVLMPPSVLLTMPSSDEGYLARW